MPDVRAHAAEVPFPNDEGAGSAPGDWQALQWNFAGPFGVNAPQAAQDVGIAMARNPVPLIIPCHRVLAAGGKLGGFSAPGRTETKARMLALEGVFIGNQPRLL